MPELFGHDDAEAGKAEGMSRVERGADPAWMDEAYAAVVRTAKVLPEFLCDDVWNVGGLQSTREDRALGPVMLRIARDGVAVKTDRLRPSVRSHLGPKPVWRSLVYDDAVLF